MAFDPGLEVLRRTQHDIVATGLERLAQRDERLSIPQRAKRKKGDLHGPFPVVTFAAHWRRQMRSPDAGWKSSRHRSTDEKVARR